MATKWLCTRTSLDEVSGWSTLWYSVILTLLVSIVATICVCVVWCVCEWCGVCVCV